MKEYHKIPTVYERDPEAKFRTLLDTYATPELKYLANCTWEWEEKVDGTNIRVIVSDGQVRFGGKTDNAQIPTFLLSRLQDLFKPEEMAEAFPDGACLYGEGFGPKIQKGGGNYGPSVDFCLFDVKVGEWWLKREDVTAVAQKLRCQYAMVVGHGTLPEMVEFVRAGFTSRWGTAPFQAEGVVARPYGVELFSRNGSRIITKLKAKDFRAERDG